MARCSSVRQLARKAHVNEGALWSRAPCQVHRRADLAGPERAHQCSIMATVARTLWGLAVAVWHQVAGLSPPRARSCPMAIVSNVL
jgi:hypothetical protein